MWSVQFHTGLGDNDLDLLFSSPAAHLQQIVRAYPNTNFVLLHSSYPYTREAGCLASMYKKRFRRGEHSGKTCGEYRRCFRRLSPEMASSGRCWPCNEPSFISNYAFFLTALSLNRSPNLVHLSVFLQSEFAVPVCQRFIQTSSHPGPTSPFWMFSLSFENPLDSISSSLTPSLERQGLSTYSNKIQTLDGYCQTRK